MTKNLLCLFLLIGLVVTAKNVTVSKTNVAVASACALNVEIVSTLDIPTSEFFVIESVLNGTAPYTYLLDGNPSPNGYRFYVSNLIVGIHTVVVTDSKDCSGTGTFEIQKLAKSEFILPNFKFYPNPAHNNLAISNNNVIEKIEIASLTGKTILTKKINTNHYEIDLSMLPTGVYLLKINSEGKEKTVKFIKE